MDSEERDKITMPSQTLHPQYTSPNISPLSQRSTRMQENSMPMVTQSHFSNFAVRPLLITPYQEPSGVQLEYTNIVHTDPRRDVFYSPSLIQDAALAPPEAKGNVFHEDKIDSDKQTKPNLNFCTPCRSTKDVVISPSKDEQDSDVRSVTNKNTSPVVKSQGSHHDSLASKKRTCSMMLTDGTKSLRTGSVHNKVSTMQNSEVYPTQMVSSLIMQMTAPEETCLIKENEEISNDRRKRSDRESGRRSKLRKQEKCQKLQATVDLLVSEISMLKRQLMRLSEDCGELYEENNCIEEEIITTHGEDAISDLQEIRPASVDK